MSTSLRHGLSVGIERFNEHIFITLKAVGTLTHEDYEIITPMIDAAIAKVTEPHVKMLIDASEMQGWELRAAWDDFKLGLKHNNDFKKIAIYGHKTWQEAIVKIGSWFVSGEVQYFERLDDAVAWLQET
ncbi:SpoIIAA family protein [Ghiorsea bivora]|uniref:STAS/SEC14 domain-containing protein n=1 Tax=Ghiorsea bivora TaxID=1485545 RepID=UPI00056DCCC9|nr:STAS/SEC14 domain-containing protein [Ghiorsea bivora]